MKIFPMVYHSNNGPRRIVCLTEEPTEILYALGESDRIVGISAYTVRPPEAKETKPVVSAFIGGSVEKICALKPDLVVGFSDIQADLARELIASNLNVLIFNQRTVQEILDVVQTLGRIVGCGAQAESLVDGYVKGISQARERAAKRLHRPRVYFEEWDDPIISGIAWVNELIEIVGGDDIFGDRADGKLAKERFVTIEEIEARNPEVYLASWCGKAFDRDAAIARFNSPIDAVTNDRIYEIDASIILQPGPACLTDGLRVLEETIWANEPSS